MYIMVRINNIFFALLRTIEYSKALQQLQRTENNMLSMFSGDSRCLR